MSQFFVIVVYIALLLSIPCVFVLGYALVDYIEYKTGWKKIACAAVVIPFVYTMLALVGYRMSELSSFIGQ